MIIKEE